jgi:hypothetical protein
MTRTRASARAAGTRFERLVADHLATTLADDRIDRRAKTGSKDRGDITGVRLPAGRGRVVIETKDCTRLDIAGWLHEADTERGNDDAAIGIVVAKRRGIADPGRQLVLMTLDDLATLLGANPQPLQTAPKEPA